MLKDFKEFIIKGNAVDLAVGFMFGAAFANVVKSFIDNIVMPPIGLLLGKVDFTNLFVALDGNEYSTLAELEAAGAPAIKYGQFITDSISFLLLGLVIFLMIRSITKMKRKDETKVEETPKTSEEVLLLQEIRDSLVSAKNK